MNNNLLLIIFFSSILSGCITNHVPPTHVYTITPNWNDSVIADKNQQYKHKILKFTPIRSTRALTSTDILYTDTLNTQNQYLYSRWNDAPTKLLQTFFQLSIEKANIFKAVISNISTSKSDFVLESSLLDLSHQLTSNTNSEGVIRIRFYLINNKTRKLIATKEFVSSIKVNSQDAKGAVAAINKAAADIANNLVQWLSETPLANKLNSGEN